MQQEVTRRGFYSGFASFCVFCPWTDSLKQLHMSLCLIYPRRMHGMFWRVCFLQLGVGYWRGGCLLVCWDPKGHLGRPVHQNPASFSCVKKLNYTFFFFSCSINGSTLCCDSLCCRLYIHHVNVAVPVMLALEIYSCHHSLAVCFKRGMFSVRW